QTALRAIRPQSGHPGEEEAAQLHAFSSFSLVDGYQIHRRQSCASSDSETLSSQALRKKQHATTNPLLRKWLIWARRHRHRSATRQVHLQSVGLLNLAGQPTRVPALT